MSPDYDPTSRSQMKSNPECSFPQVSPQKVSGIQTARNDATERTF